MPPFKPSTPLSRKLAGAGVDPKKTQLLRPEQRVPFRSYTCGRKIAHHTEESVKREAERLALRTSQVMNHYKCGVCKLFHVGKPVVKWPVRFACVACQDSGKDSKGNDCWPCLVDGRIPPF